MSMTPDSQPQLGEMLAAGNAPSDILIAQVMLDDYGPNGSRTDSFGNTWRFYHNDGTYVAVAGFIYKIDFSRVYYQDPFRRRGPSYKASWPD